jgi:hypothetical protein
VDELILHQTTMALSEREKQTLFRSLRGVLAKHARSLQVVTDTEDHYYLNTTHIMPNRRPLFFGAVRVCRGYVAYHLMPLYVFPDLLKRVPPRLLARMHGKSCFNFQKMDQAVLTELSMLTRLGFDRYRQENLL